MSEYRYQEEYRPVAWVRGYPVYGSYLIVGIFLASMIATAILMAANAMGVLLWLTFDSRLVLRGEVWRAFTYGLVNSPANWGFYFDMYVIAVFAREVEMVFGLRKFLALFACLYLLPPALFTAAGHWVPVVLPGETGAFALFVAFAALYPNVSVFFGVVAKWAAAILFGIFSLIALADHDWVSGVCLWSMSAFAVAFVRFEQGRLTLPRFRLFERKPKFRVIQGSGEVESEGGATGSMAEIDEILDKIARSGMGSLTAKERARLASARDDIARRGSGRR